MIEKLIIHRFRGIREGIISDLSKINILVGPNNSGKSAILEILYLGGVCGRPCGFLSLEPAEEVFSIKAWVPVENDFLYYCPFSRIAQRHGYQEIWKDAPGGLTEASSLAYNLDSLPDSHPLRHFKLIPPQSEKIHTYEGFSEKDIKSTTFFTMLPSKDLPSLFPATIKDRSLDFEKSRLAYLWYPEFVFKGNHVAEDLYNNLAVWALEGHMPSASHVFLFDFNTTSSHFTQSFFEYSYTHISDWYEKISEALGEIFPEMKGCKVEMIPIPGKTGEMIGTVRFHGQRPLLIDDFGDGARHSFKVIAGLIALSESMKEGDTGLFLWEDPELFMHPVALKKLLEKVIDIIRDKPIQVFITTQSLELLAYVAQMMAENYIMEDMVRAYSMELHAGHLEPRILWGTTLNDLLLNGFDPRLSGNGLVTMDSPLVWHLKDEEETL